jgi:hypothetical protein
MTNSTGFQMRVTAAVLSLGFCTAVHAQIGQSGAKTEIKVGDTVSAVKDGKVVRHTIADGEKVVENGESFVITKGRAAKVGSSDHFELSDGSVVHVPPSFTITVDPLAVFTFAGSLGDTGGTKSFGGGIIAPEYSFAIGGNRSLEIGGFYFLEERGHDVYQLDVKMFFNREMGAQLAYLNIKKGGAPALTGFGLYRLTSPPKTRRDWNLLFGVGAYLNLANQIDPQEGGGGNTIFPEAPVSTVNFTFFMNGSFSLGKNVSLTASHWYIRDRNSELNRFALGLSFKL